MLTDTNRGHRKLPALVGASKSSGGHADENGGDLGIDKLIGVGRRAEEKLLAQHAPHGRFEVTLYPTPVD